MGWFSRLFGGGNDNPPPSPPSLPPPPSREELMDFIDKVSGYQTITVKGANGKLQRVTERLPRDPQKQEFYNRMEKLLGDTIQGIIDLDRYDPEKVVKFQPFIDRIAEIDNKRLGALAELKNLGNIQENVNAFRQIKERIVNENIERGRRSLETDLARRGLSNSTSGNERRALFDREALNAQEEADFAARNYGEQLADKRLSRNIAQYNVGEDARQQELRGAQTEYDLMQREAQDKEAARRQALSEKYNQFKIASGLISQEDDKPNNTPQLSLQQEGLDLNRYGHNIARLNSGYQNQLAGWGMQQQYRQPSFGEFLGNAVANGIGTAGSAMLMGPPGSGGAMLASKLFG